MPAESGNSTKTVDFVRLFTESAQRLYSYILVLLPDEDAASDVFQEISVTLWEKFDQFQPGTNFWAWAKQIAFYKVSHYRQRETCRALPMSESMLAQLAAETEDVADLRTRRHMALADCMNQLPTADRDVVKRRYMPGSTTEKVARDTGRSLHQTYRALRRIHRVLFDCISRSLAAGGDS